jgi:hypothetical protein
VLASASSSFGQAQNDAQQKCLNGLNKAGAGVSKTQGKEHNSCLKEKGKGTLVGTAQNCLTADLKDKVLKAKGKTTKVQTDQCGTAPDFGFTSATAINNAAVAAGVSLVADVYGANLDAATISCASSATGCACQQKISKDVEKIVATKLKEFLKCKKDSLKNGANSIAALKNCVDNAGTPGSIAADTKQKILKAVSKLKASIGKKCDLPGVTNGAFPGDCDTLTGNPLGDCLDVQVECRVCQMLNAMDNLGVDCELFDDGNGGNGSCVTAPTPTPTVSPTPTPTATSTPDGIFAGAIAKTSGAWNYDAVNGLAGGELECNDHFPGSHVCEYTELLAAETAGELVGITDVNAILVTSFWSVDHTPGLATDNNQCISTTGTIRWFYGTAHTASNASFVDLNNGTGDLGPNNVGTVECAAAPIRSVGCCY